MTALEKKISAQYIGIGVALMMTAIILGATGFGIIIAVPIATIGVMYLWTGGRMRLKKESNQRTFDGICALMYGFTSSLLNPLLGLAIAGYGCFVLTRVGFQKGYEFFYPQSPSSEKTQTSSQILFSSSSVKSTEHTSHHTNHSSS